MRRLFLIALGVGVISCADRGWQAHIPEDWPFDLAAEPVRAASGMVVSTDAYASEVGIEILKAGGNAVDAAVATSFALAVVNPEAGNIGGGGFMLIRLADGTSAALDYREIAPRAAHRDMYLDDRGNLTQSSKLGHLAVGVPGTVAGLWEAHQQHGSLEWEQLVEPAIRLADAFEVRERQARSLRWAEDDLRVFPTTEATFLPDDRPPHVGEVFQQSQLAHTLRRIQGEGRDGFYRGVTADLIVQEMEHGGGLITYEDLEGYNARWREPIEFTYRGYTVISMSPASSGGPTLAAMAQILEGYDVGSMGWHSPEMIHYVAEAWKRAYADRNAYLADPDFVEMPIERMISADYGKERRQSIAADRSTPSLEVGPGLGTPDREQNTTHLSIVDAQGNAVSLTTTINSFYGSKVTVTGAGFILNNEMDDFTARPSQPNQYGAVQGENNAIEPGKRMLSAMTPTVVEYPDGRLFLVLGTPGGATIITDVFQNISNVIDFGMPIRQAVNVPRLHHQHLPDEIEWEPGSLPAETVDALEAMGHTMRELPVTGEVYPYIGDIQAIMVIPDGTLEGASDPRRGGTAAGY